VRVVGSRYRVERRGFSSVRIGFIRDGHQYQYVQFAKGGNHSNVNVTLRPKTSQPATAKAKGTP
jgi:hypothetical protein